MKCAICGKDISGEKGYLYFKPNQDEIWIICKTCEQTLNCITNPRRMRWVHLAIARIEECLEQITDERLAQELREDIKNRKYRIGMHMPHL